MEGAIAPSGRRLETEIDAPGVDCRAVAVVSDMLLVAESVRAALESRGIRTGGLSWSVTDRVGRRDHPRLVADVMVVVSEATRLTMLDGLRLTLERADVPRIVLTSSERGPIWGALLASGADVVTATSTGLAQLEQLIEDVVVRGYRMHEDDVHDLLGLWLELSAEQEAVAARLSLLTPREAQVLRLLRVGQPVRAIANAFDVAEATVRSQVKSLLRKLDVSSQLSAVAAIRVLDE